MNERKTMIVHYNWCSANHFRISVLLDHLCHLGIIAISVAGAFLMRFDFAIPSGVASILREAAVIAVLVKLPVFAAAGFHRAFRRFAGVADLYGLILGNLAASALFAVACIIWIGPPMPRSIWLIDGLLCLSLTAFLRFSVRIRNDVLGRFRRKGRRIGILIYGAGSAGTELLREIRSTVVRRYQVKGFLDDDPAKQGRRIMGVPVLGRGRDAVWIIERLNRRRPEVEEIILAMPSASGPDMREALAICRASKLPCKTIPGVNELLSGKVLMSQVRNLPVAGLLGRPPVKLETASIRSTIAGRCVLVTGAAGSIGSELCRQVAGFAPERLIALDQAESALFKVECELRNRYRNLDLIAAVGDIRNRERLDHLLQRYSVDAVFHAAAYKHVPLMESHVIEAVSNNIFGTWNLLCEARRHGVRSFLMISSDKAVNPTSVMGVTKRVCERIVSARDGGSAGPAMKCVSVRFGNVLGSNGSVVPIFQSQIEAGGPVKVTHPDMRRYFMTTSEAVALVLQASTMGKGSEIFVLDMGEPVRIVDLASNMIREAGLVPGEDIEIQFTGPRPGEKLFEEMNGRDERVLPTYHEKIQIFEEACEDQSTIEHWIDKLEDLVADWEEEEVIAHIRDLVPEYEPRGRWAARHESKDTPARARISPPELLSAKGAGWTQ